MKQQANEIPDFFEEHGLDRDHVIQQYVTCIQIARQSVASMRLPKLIELPAALESLGVVANRHYQEMLHLLEGKYGEALPLLVGFAWTQYWQAAWEGSTWVMLNLKPGFREDGLVARQSAKPDGYMRYSNRGEVLIDRHQEIAEEWPQWGLTGDADIKDVLFAVACFLFRSADRGMLNQCGAVDTVIESVCAAEEVMLCGNMLWPVDEDDKYAVDSALDQAVSVEQLVRLEAHKLHRKQASDGGKARAESKYGKDKALVKECWDDWQTGKRTYCSGAAFDRDMIDKCQEAKAVSTFRSWRKEWEAAAEKRSN